MPSWTRRRKSGRIPWEGGRSMRLYFKQRFFSWFDSYDIYDEATGEPVFTVEGKLISK